MWRNGPTSIVAMPTMLEVTIKKMMQLVWIHRDQGQGVPTTMPKPRAKQVAGRIAMDTALDMAEAIENSGAGPSSSMEPRSLGVVNDSNYLLSSVPVANFFHVMPVPREPLALDDYRWDLLGQGIGPENLLVIKC